MAGVIVPHQISLYWQWKHNLLWPNVDGPSIVSQGTAIVQEKLQPIYSGLNGSHNNGAGQLYWGQNQQYKQNIPW